MGLPILRISSKKAGVANGGSSSGKYVTRLPFPQLSRKPAEVDIFNNFPTYIMSVRKTLEDGNVSIFTKEGVSVYKKKDVIINCKGKAIFVSKSDERGKYRITLVQSRGQWKPRKLTNRAKKYLQQANSVYDLPSTEETINWMHAVCEYLVKSTCIKDAKEGNFVGWPTLNERNVEKYYQKK